MNLPISSLLKVDCMRRTCAFFLVSIISLSIITNNVKNIKADTVQDLSTNIQIQEEINTELSQNHNLILPDTEMVEQYVGGGKTVSYIFTPEVNGKYAFSVETDSGLIQSVPVYVKIYDQDNNLIAQSNNSAISQLVYCDLYSKKSYYLTYFGNSGDVYATGRAKIYRVGNLPNGNGEEINTTDELWQDGEDIKIENINDIMLNEEKKVDISIFGAKSVHKFVPTESGEYELNASGNENVFFSLLNEKLNYINSGSSPFTMKLEVGKTYIITSRISSSSDNGLGEYVIAVKKKASTDSPLILKGDINVDEKVNAEDALIILKHAAKINLIANDRLDVADVNEDTIIDAKDALEVLMSAARITE